MSSILAALNDREYFRQLFSLALPIALQQLVWASLNMVGLLMIGQLGEAPVAAVGLGNQVFFLLTLVLFGINSGSAMFTAQLWGKGERHTVRKVLALALSLSLFASSFFLLISRLAPEAVLSIYSKDPAVVEQGSQYLSIYSLSFVFAAISFSYAAVLRSTGQVRIPIAINMAALALNTVLSYILIFGYFGMPALGVRGAGWSIVIARALECFVLLLITYRSRLPAALTLVDLRALSLPFAIAVFKPVLPVVFNELLWALGVTAYNVVYARIGTDSIAAMNIVGTIDNLAFVVFIGLANACAILVGNRIGAGEEDTAYRNSGRTIVLGVICALLVGGLILATSGLILDLYKVSPVVIEYARRVLVIISLSLWLRVSNLVIYIGIFRAGGDTLFAFLLETLIIWTVGVPLAFFGAFVLHLPVYWVYLLVLSEELVKWAIGLWRYASRRWIHNLAATVG